MVSRIYVEKKPGFDHEAQSLLKQLRDFCGLTALERVRLINRYDVAGLDEQTLGLCIPSVFSEPQVDMVSRELPFDSDAVSGTVFAVSLLPGQFDQRAASAAECVQLITKQEAPLIAAARVYMLEGNLDEHDVAEAKRYLINPVEACEVSLDTVESIAIEHPEPSDVTQIEGFLSLSVNGLDELRSSMGLAMDVDDLVCLQTYFLDQGRCPTVTEVRVIDTYWSDHCRHTTFHTLIDEITIDDGYIQDAFSTYLDMRHETGRDTKPSCLMDMATIGAKWLKMNGELAGVDESEEINACTIKVPVDVDGTLQDWLLLFKNETHNHPTEIEPFGGAATCIGGAIRDPLSGRSYVYQAMRLSGGANPLTPIEKTLPGKLPQQKIARESARGYSSYGNQIGLATGLVHEFYHPGYAAKHMEIGAVIGATPASHVRREVPKPGDIIVLVGGKTGRDGIGGATGSSKAHEVSSLTTCGAEVQKGNAPIERKLQRLFRREDACKLIKRCNDFGAGGVAVAVGEIARGLDINLDSVPTKYDGLDATELAISESQERMAVALSPQDVDLFLRYAAEENLEATPIARVTANDRLRMFWHDTCVVDIARDFLDTNGATKHITAAVEQQQLWSPVIAGATIEDKLASLVSDINVASQRGLMERFDSTIGAASVLTPLGGKTQLTPAQAMVAKLPVDGETSSVSGMAYGYNPYLMEADQFSGSYLAVVESMARLIATGFKRKSSYLTFQEYFERLSHNPKRWGKPVAALLGALMAQKDLHIAAIGGKDSMSGSFEDLDVAPTLVSFSVATGDVSTVISPEFKRDKSILLHLSPIYRPSQGGSYKLIPETDSLISLFSAVEELTANHMLLSASTAGYGGLAEALFLGGVGNTRGIVFDSSFDEGTLFAPAYGSFIVELASESDVSNVMEQAASQGFNAQRIGTTTTEYTWQLADKTLDMSTYQTEWEHVLEPVYPWHMTGEPVVALTSTVAHARPNNRVSLARPRVVIPVFPGTNCEFDTVKAFKQAGADPHVIVINNLAPEHITRSVQEVADEIRKSQIVMIPGGFSGGDEPDGSAKFITSFFRSAEVTDAVRDLLQARDGLMLGICNGFQALIKLGLVPFGDICDVDATCPTLTHNVIGRHQSSIVHTRVASCLSPWLSRCAIGDVHSVAISHGEGRFVASDEMMEQLIAHGQIATQYCDADGMPSMDIRINPNGSYLAVEGITSLDGRVFGKMGHSERIGTGLYKNLPNASFADIIGGGVDYFVS